MMKVLSAILIPVVILFLGVWLLNAPAVRPSPRPSPGVPGEGAKTVGEPAAANADPSGAIPAFQGGGNLRGVAEAVAAPPYLVRWHIKVGNDENRASIENSPTIAGDTAYVADSLSVLHALMLADGKERWQYKSEGGFATTPLVLGNRIYLGDLAGLLHCISTDKGNKIWTFDSGGGIHSSANVTPDRKAILFGNDSAQVYAVDAQTGKQIWQGQGGDRINACPAIGFGAAFFTGCDARLMGLNLKDGTEKFAVELGALAPGSPTILEDAIIAGTGEGTVIAMSSDGKKQLWKYDQVDEQGAMFYSSPAAAEGLIVIGCRDRQVHAIDAAAGKRAWAFKTKGDVDASPVISGGRVFVPSKDKYLYVLDLKSGKKLWDFKAGRAIEAGVAIGGGAIVFGDSAGNIYCLEPKK